MKVLIIGAHGKIGKIVTQKMAELSDFEPVAFIRNEEQKSYFNALNVPVALSSLEYDVATLKEVIKDFDTVIFTAGSGGKTGADKTLEIDLDGAVKTMIAAEESKAKRYVIVSAAYADDRAFWETSSIKSYYVAKHFADLYLKNSSLDYTIVRPVALTDDKGVGKLTKKTDVQELQKTIPREDVADFIIEALQTDASKGKVYELSTGDQAITEVI